MSVETVAEILADHLYWSPVYRDGADGTDNSLADVTMEQQLIYRAVIMQYARENGQELLLEIIKAFHRHYNLQPPFEHPYPVTED